jgi:hypothetical protein
LRCRRPIWRSPQYGEHIETAKRAAGEAIRINLEACSEAGQQAPEGQSVSNHLENPEFRDLLFAYVEVALSTTPLRHSQHSKITPPTTIQTT